MKHKNNLETLLDNNKKIGNYFIQKQKCLIPFRI